MQSYLSSLPASELEGLMASLSIEEKLVLLFDWAKWARPEQVMPDGDWAGWLILAGRGWGKTKTGAEAVRGEVEAGRAGRIALVAETSADGRDVIVEGESGILAISPPWNRPRYEPSKRRLTWDNGAIATLYDATIPDQLRGPQHDLVLFDELAKYRYAEAVFDNAMFGLRLGAHPRWIATTTPRPIPLLKKMLQDSSVHVTRGKTDENLINLAPTFRRNVVDKYRGTRLGRQELDGEMLGDVPGALWSQRVLNENRVQVAPALQRIVVGVDPAGTSGPSSNETGIIAAGIDGEGHAYVLSDWSLKGSPDEWARKVVAAFRLHAADQIVAETNQGGDMVVSVIQSVMPGANVKKVHAARGKYVRAEPISALYEQGRVHHVGTLVDLEDQMTAFTANLDRKTTSPDRVDALVWALSELFPDVISASIETDNEPASAYFSSPWG